MHKANIANCSLVFLWSPYFCDEICSVSSFLDGKSLCTELYFLPTLLDSLKNSQQSLANPAKLFYIGSMALPIRSTPILSGKSAERFYLMAKDVRENKWKTVDFSEQTKLGKKILKKAKI